MNILQFNSNPSIEKEVDCFIDNYLAPTGASNQRRQAIHDFVHRTLSSHMTSSSHGVWTIGCGSSSLKSYLPESDLDLVLLTPKSTTKPLVSNSSNVIHIINNHNNDEKSNEDTKTLSEIFNSLCQEICLKDDGKSNNPHMTIRNVEFINARTKVAHCLVNNVGVDITVNQIGALISLIFLEEVDRVIGCNHLFKRSLLLIKAWCMHDSFSHCQSKTPILGAKAGMLSSYAMSIMVLHTFSTTNGPLHHPYHVLRAFLAIFSNFSWENHLITIDGPIPIINGSVSYGHAPVLSRFQKILDKFKDEKIIGGVGFGLGPESDTSYEHDVAGSPQTSRSNSIARSFSIRCCNILDPMDPFNNLGTSVSRYNLAMIDMAIRNGNIYLNSILNMPRPINNTRDNGMPPPNNNRKSFSNNNSINNNLTAMNANDNQSSSDKAASSNRENQKGRRISTPNNSNNNNNTNNNSHNNNNVHNNGHNVPHNVHNNPNIAHQLTPVSPSNLGYVGHPSFSANQLKNNTNVGSFPDFTSHPSTQVNYDNRDRQIPPVMPTVTHHQHQINHITNHKHNNNNHNVNMNTFPMQLHDMNMPMMSSTVGMTIISDPLHQPYPLQPPLLFSIEYWFLYNFFPHSCKHYFSHHNSIRSDLLDHPLQKHQTSFLTSTPPPHDPNNGIAMMDNFSISSSDATSHDDNLSTESKRLDPFYADCDDMWQTLRQCYAMRKTIIRNNNNNIPAIIINNTNVDVSDNLASFKAIQSPAIATTNNNSNNNNNNDNNNDQLAVSTSLNVELSQNISNSSNNPTEETKSHHNSPAHKLIDINK
eukprot:gene4838-6782_t